jgi:hypothetical protein
MGLKGTIGNASKTGYVDYDLAGYTFIIYHASWKAPCSGIIRSIDFNDIKTGGTFKIKVFRVSGANFVFVRESGVSLSAGNNTVPLQMRIDKDEYLGFYSSTGETYTLNSPASAEYWVSGDVTTTIAIASCSSGAGSSNLKGYIYSFGGVIL